MTGRRLLLLIPASLIVLAACSWYWLLHTTSGAHWIWARAASATGGALQAQQLQGDLGSGLTIRRLTFSTDSMTLEIREIRLVADLDLVPLQLQISEVVIDDTAVQIFASDAKPQSGDLRNTNDNLALPLSLVIKDVKANSVSLSGLIPDNDIVLTQVSLAGSWHEDIVIDQLLVVTSSPIAMSVRGSVSNLLQSLSWDLQAQLTETTLDFGQNNTEVHIAAGHATSSGSLDEYSVTVSAKLDTLAFDAIQFNTTGTGTTSSFQFSDLGLNSKDVDLSGIGRIAWGSNWSIESRLSIATFDLSVLLEDWPAEHPLRGELSLLLDEDHLAISDSYLAADDTDMSVQMDANVDLLTSVVTGAVRWENAKWPVGGDDPAISSKSGNIAVAGSIDDWRINGDIDVGTATMPLGRIRIDGSGDRHHLEAAIIDSEALGGKVSGYGAFNWRDQQSWSAGLDLSSIELGAFADDWPNNITGRVDGDGQMLPFLLNLQLSDVDAEFLGRPLSANGQVKLTDDHFMASDLKILHGDTRIELDGDPFVRAGLEFDIAVADASMYLGEANGTFAATGRVSLYPEQPSLRIDASSPSFGFGPIQATGIEIVDRSGDDGIVNAEITAEQLDIQGSIFEHITINFLADAAEQSLRLAAAFGNAEVQIFAAGKLDDLQHPGSWRGELREFNLALNGEALAALSAPTAMSFSDKSVTIDRSCVAASTGMRLCAEADWSADEYLQIAADLADLPVNLINGLIETGLQFDQLVSGNFAWSQSKESSTRGNAEVTMTAGTVVGIDYPDIAIETDTGVLSFDVVDGQLLSGNAGLSMPGFGHVAAQVSIPDLALGSNSRVNGMLDLDLSNMAVLAALSPLVDAASGEIRADLTLSGTLSEPLLVGDLAVINGSMIYLPIGLRLDQIKLTSLLHDDGQMELSGNFKAGEGYGEIVTRADYATTGATGFELELRGNNMTLIDVPNITARADLDIRVGYDFKTLLLDGQVLIAHARVNPSSLTLSSQTESEDVVIIAGELPDDPTHQPGEQEAWIAGSIGVAFGDDVLIDLGPATAKLTGDTTFTWDEDLVPIADGRYDVTGSIQVFGQVLEITEGGLRFPKIPADNPFVRIRAEREIYGNAQVKTAGVLVDGTLKQLSVGPYTRPETTEERALTLLVTGSDFDFEQGLGAIDFGTYIAPRIFVSYGVGLFETENVIRIRYDLKRGFGITATSGQKESGVDLSYRIER